MKIEDGTGSGRQAAVDGDYRLRTFSVIEPEDKHVNREGGVWSIHQSTTAAGTDDYVFYIKNTGTDPLALTDIRVITGAATTLYIDHVTGTPTFTAGVDLTPLNRNLGNTEAPTATIKEDTNTTGLSLSGTIFFQRCAAANTQYHLSTTSNIIIPKSQALAIRTSAATSVEMLVSLVLLED